MKLFLYRKYSTWGNWRLSIVRRPY